MKSYKDFLNELYNLIQISPENKKKDTQPRPTTANKKDPFGKDPAVIAAEIRANNKARKKLN